MRLLEDRLAGHRSLVEVHTAQVAPEIAGRVEAVLGHSLAILEPSEGMWLRYLVGAGRCWDGTEGPVRGAG